MVTKRDKSIIEERTDGQGLLVKDSFPSKAPGLVIFRHWQIFVNFSFIKQIFPETKKSSSLDHHKIESFTKFLEFLKS